MHFSEDELRAALRRKEPGAAFTERVMARIRETEFGGKEAPMAKPWILRVRPWLAGAVAAAVLTGAAWLGAVQHRRSRELAEGKRAKQQAILALHIANAKLNHVFERVR